MQVLQSGLFFKNIWPSLPFPQHFAALPPLSSRLHDVYTRFPDSLRPRFYVYTHEFHFKHVPKLDIQECV